jgi:hypothetical protein
MSENQYFHSTHKLKYIFQMKPLLFQTKGITKNKFQFVNVSLSPTDDTTMLPIVMMSR